MALLKTRLLPVTFQTARSKCLLTLLLLHDPNPHPLLCVEEPENQLYPSLFGGLVEEFRDYADKGGQVMISTHSPDVFKLY